MGLNVRPTKKAREKVAKAKAAAKAETAKKEKAAAKAEAKAKAKAAAKAKAKAEKAKWDKMTKNERHLDHLDKMAAR